MKAPLLEVAGIHKRFPGVEALNDVHLAVYPAEIHAVVGENGSGKSTLMKVIAGVYQPDEGTIRVDGRAVDAWNPVIAQRAGIAVIHQELTLFPDLSVAENTFMVKKSFTRGGLVRWRTIRRETERLISYLNVTGIDPTQTAASLSIAGRQIVEIVKALATVNLRVLLMDEPTSALSVEEVENLFRVTTTLKNDGVGIVFISHKIDEVTAIADRITILRDGNYVATKPADDTNHDELIRLMIGRDLSYLTQRSPSRREQILLAVYGLRRRGVFEGITFKLHKGEILGIFGLVGARRTEVAQALFGVVPASDGEITLEDRRVVLRNSAEALRAGIALIPEDRGTQGLVLQMNIPQNLSLPSLPELFPLRVVSASKEREVAQGMCRRLDVKFASLAAPVDSLSGGNKQKVVVGKWLMTRAKVLIFDEPTKGIDVGAKEVIHELMSELANEGIGIIMISSELPEIVKMSDSILVMAKGRITGRFERNRVTQDRIMQCASLMTELHA